MSQSPLQLSRGFLAAMGTRTFVHYEDRIPIDTPVLLVSNHRSFMDAPVLMAALGRPIRFACHHYMGQVPVMREFVSYLGCFPLSEPEKRQHSFVRQGSSLLQSQQVVGVFPEGAQPMVQTTRPWQVGEFHRGFAHLALRSPVENLAVLPVAIASTQETIQPSMPVKFLSLFDPTEPLFDRWSWHPMVLYHRLSILIGRPYWITPAVRQAYHGRKAKTTIAHLVDFCHDEITTLVRQGCKMG
ncbi:MAG TPA: 1-acyl-sn-glycerol-3-phosphate acyltransferase [Oscillatoriales cyanobacterium M59_W2019_021]|nr:1-acyl-sn-glycerol-3-phosphate acyltransferase [Oscillatoriales cyanobacterium M4454_W2019_049]HIK53006.1 1-acyl-sn-glycerol-3-phosphate acyltransferase [Oscillatoriales cyanobacterium M59_W2019_021]